MSGVVPMMNTRRHAAWKSVLTLRGRVLFLTALSLLLMAVGHWKIVGQVFDPLSGETYNLFTRWVSDFAAKHPEGWWIKASILTFCVALVGFFRRLSRTEARDMAGVWRGFAVLSMASLMIGGLVLVAVFDLSPKQYELIESRVILDRARAGDAGADEPEASWWDVFFDPKRATLREEMLRDAPLPDEYLEPLREKITTDSWDQDQVREYLRQIAREQEEAAAAEEENVETHRELRPVPKGAKELSKHWYHRLGFQMFLAGFMLASIWIARREWRDRQYDRLPGTLLGLCLMIIFGAWLMAEKLGLAGVPQRALLGLIGYWLIRNLPHALGHTPDHTPAQDAEASA